MMIAHVVLLLLYSLIIITCQATTVSFTASTYTFLESLPFALVEVSRSGGFDPVAVTVTTAAGTALGTYL